MKNQTILKHFSFKPIAFLLFLFMFSSFSLRAQESATESPTLNQKKIELDVKMLNTDQDVKRIEDMLNSAPGKILNHSIDKKFKKVTVAISENLQVVDLLELFDGIGLSAGFIDENNDYVKLDANGYLTKLPSGTK